MNNDISKRLGFIKPSLKAGLIGLALVASVNVVEYFSVKTNLALLERHNGKVTSYFVSVNILYDYSQERFPKTMLHKGRQFAVMEYIVNNINSEEEMDDEEKVPVRYDNSKTWI